MGFRPNWGRNDQICISKSDTDRIVLLSAEVDLPHADEIGKLLVNLIPKSYNEDNKRPF